MKLRILKIKDIPFILEWMKDKNVNRFFKFNPESIDEESVKNYIISSWGDIQNKHFAITTANDEYVGTISLKNINHINKHAEYAISLRKSAQGNGYGKYATVEILKIAFHELKLNKVYLNVLEYNKHAIAFYEKLGFKYDGIFKKHIYKDGKYHNLKWYSYMKEDFKNDF